MINILLCGGSGTRLWPLSRKLLPKQFVKIFGDNSLYQKTIRRNSVFCNETVVVSNIDQYFLAKDQANDIGAERVSYILEPIAKNTAPAIALACLGLDENEIVFVTPSDHLVKNEDGYHKAILEAKKLAEEGYIVTFGIIPDFPETGFGYIEAKCNDVLSFKEKPSYELAKKYLEAGTFYWNSGMFCFKVKTLMEELEKFSPALFESCKTTHEDSITDNDTIRFRIESMEHIIEESIDYAVMEKSNRIKVVPADIGWSDLGSFDSLYEESVKDESGNAIIKRGEDDLPVINVGSKNNLVVSRSHAIAMIDVEDLIVVDTTDSILISKKGSSQKVKEIFAALRLTKPELCDVHRLAFRPWGSYEVLLDSEKYKIKRIIVTPGNKLSLQKHFHRSEHWIVVSGTAEVTNGDDIFLVRANESTYIPMGQVHRLENKGKIDLVMIEVQVGEYTGEDDIVRLEDVYGRK